MVWALYVQAGLALLLMAAIALTPVRRGAMIVFPIGGAPAKPWVDAQPDITLIGIGALPGSLVVKGDRNLLWPIAAGHHAILLPAIPLLCAAATPGS